MNIDLILKHSLKGAFIHRTLGYRTSNWCFLEFASPYGRVENCFSLESWNSCKIVDFAETCKKVLIFLESYDHYRHKEHSGLKNLKADLCMSILIPFVFLSRVENTLCISLVIIIELESGNTNNERHKRHNVEPMYFVLVIMVLFNHEEQVCGHK
jgi:hypothetical protein